MVELVTGDNALEAWQEGARLLVQEKEIFNLVTSIRNPVCLDVKWFNDYDPSDHSRNRIASLSDVVNTIFPYKYLDKGYSMDQMRTNYLRAHGRKKRWPSSKNSWGTYYERMISFGAQGEREGEGINQLGLVIEKVKKWSNKPTSALVMHMSSVELDKPRIMGSPCLQYIELLFKTKDTISLLAVYRNHDFFAKALGNFIGLGQLLKFMCRETGKHPGDLVCHSARAGYHPTTKAAFQTYAQV